MSQMSREDILRELELLPVWQLRQPLPTPFITETPATDTSEQFIVESVAEESAITDQQPNAADMPAIEIAVAVTPLPEPPIPESSIPEPASSALSLLEVAVPQQMEVVETIEEEPVLNQAPLLPLRLLLSEDSQYAFLIEPYATEDDVQQIETLLKNMIRAMQITCRVDMTDSADNIFATHAPKLIISLGAEPANRLSGKAYTIDEWRNTEQDNQPRYELIPLIVTYHPAHLLANAADKALAWRDLCAAMKLVKNL